MWIDAEIKIKCIHTWSPQAIRAAIISCARGDIGVLAVTKCRQENH